MTRPLAAIYDLGMRNILGLLLVFTGAAGCVRVSDSNSSPVLIGMNETRSAAASKPDPAGDTQPSITGLSRAHWPEYTYVIGSPEVEHQPLYRSSWALMADASPLQRGEYPSIENADAAPSGRGSREQRYEALLLPVQGLADVLFMPVRAWEQSPITPIRGHVPPVQRTPRKPAQQHQP